MHRANASDTHYTGSCDDGPTSEELHEKQPLSCNCDEGTSEQCGDGMDLVACSYSDNSMFHCSLLWPQLAF